ncbi:Ribosomal L1 domain-containing protein [Pseudolycoriella hygida]|uniref:Ribosomal L1 domain-containing protein n=1 Tax=Pseudolycoriella hygida TaxID=35572 RepID=A0A9Q0N4P5_9DIPT|nr:Ribosomal L1 domain-containing protein [Pseudolycoriella hygida]
MGKVNVTEAAKQKNNAQTASSKKPRANRGAARNTAASRLAFSQRWLEDNDKERKPFADELFNTVFSKESIQKLVNVVKNATETEVNESRRLLPDDYIYSLQITSQRTPHVPVHLSRILLPHSIENADGDVCLFVRDLKRGRKMDFEPTIKHYEQLLRSKKVTQPITIIPVNQLYNEYSSFELRRKLTYLYDKFLVDKAVATHVNGFLGNKIMMKGRSAIPIDLESENLPDEIDTNLRKVFYKHINNGIVQMVQVGRHSMSDEQIAENIIELLKQLGALHPGGSNNIFKLHLKPNVNISVAVPVYTNTESADKLRPANVPKTIAPDADGVTKLRIQGKSLVGDNIVATDDEMEGNDPKPSGKTEAAKPAGNTAKVDDAQIQNLILASLKKIVSSDSTPKKAAGASTGGTANKTIARRPVTARTPARNANNSNRQQSMGGGSGRGGMGSLNRGNGNNMLSDFGLNFGNDMGNNMRNNMDDNMGFGGNLRGNSNFDSMMNRGMSDFNSDFGGVGMRRSNMMGMGGNFNSMGSGNFDANNRGGNSGMGMSGSNFNRGNMWGNSNNSNGGGGGFNNSWNGNSNRF